MPPQLEKLVREQQQVREQQVASLSALEVEAERVVVSGLNCGL